MLHSHKGLETYWCHDNQAYFLKDTCPLRSCLGQFEGLLHRVELMMHCKEVLTGSVFKFEKQNKKRSIPALLPVTVFTYCMYGGCFQLFEDDLTLIVSVILQGTQKCTCYRKKKQQYCRSKHFYKALIVPLMK